MIGQDLGLSPRRSRTAGVNGGSRLAALSLLAKDLAGRGKPAQAAGPAGSSGLRDLITTSAFWFPTPLP
jgi:hypothetical protein